jgi:SP family facilitated glucose transporter-like MFS transporter 1
MDNSITDLLDDNNRRTGNVNVNDPTTETEKVQIHDKGMTGTLLLAVLAAVSGTSFPFGYSAGVMNAPQDVIEAFINDTSHRRNNHTNIDDSTVTLIFSLAVSVFALGGMLGGLFGGFITDRLGRKGGMYVNNIISAVACILMFISKPVASYEVLILGRFLIGLACGYGSSVAPTYINEVSPGNLRGTLGSAFQLGIVVLLFVSQIVSLQPLLGSATMWNYALGLPIVFSILQVILLFFVPESPKFLLLKKNNPVEAEKALQWLRKHKHVHHEVTEMQDEKNQQQQAAGIGDLFRTPTVRWALVITVVLQLSQQLCGINAVIYYSVIIFKRAGYDQTTSEYVNLGIGAVNIVVTIISTALMDRLGRRVLHMTGLAGTLVTITLLTISLLVTSTPAWNLISLIMTVLYVALFAVGPGSIPWLITAELFSQAYRVPASSIAVLVNWSACFVVGLAFKPLFTNVTHEYTFLIFAGLLILFILFTFFFVPETKAKNVDTIYAEINAGQVWRKRHPQSLYHDNRGGQVNDVGSTVDYGILASA